MPDDDIIQTDGGDSDSNKDSESSDENEDLKDLDDRTNEAVEDGTIDPSDAEDFDGLGDEVKDLVEDGDDRYRRCEAYRFLIPVPKTKSIILL